MMIMIWWWYDQKRDFFVQFFSRIRRHTKLPISLQLHIIFINFTCTTIATTYEWSSSSSPPLAWLKWKTIFVISYKTSILKWLASLNLTWWWWWEDSERYYHAIILPGFFSYIIVIFIHAIINNVISSMVHHAMYHHHHNLHNNPTHVPTCCLAFLSSLYCTQQKCCFNADRWRKKSYQYSWKITHAFFISWCGRLQQASPPSPPEKNGASSRFSTSIIITILGV